MGLSKQIGIVEVHACTIFLPGEKETEETRGKKSERADADHIQRDFSAPCCGPKATRRVRKAGRGPVVLVCLLCAPNKYSLFYQQNKFPFWPLHMYK